MATLTQPLHDEHRELFPQVERILQLAESIPSTSESQLRTDLQQVYSFLALHLLAHAHAEEVALYPVVQQALGSADATRTMVRDHVEIGKYVEELAVLKTAAEKGSLSAGETTALQRVLYGVYALLKVHFAKEEEVYLPILDRYLTPATAAEMFEKMETAAHAPLSG